MSSVALQYYYKHCYNTKLACYGLINDYSHQLFYQVGFLVVQVSEHECIQIQHCNPTYDNISV